MHQKRIIGRQRLNIVTTLANQLTATACGIVVPYILISSFGSETYGITVSITQFLSYIALLESGIGGVARGQLYGALATNSDAEVSKVFYAVKRFFLYVAGAFLIYSIVIGVLYRDIAHTTLYSRWYLFALVIVISLSTLAKYMGGLANLTLIVADQRQYINNYIVIVTTILNTIAIIALVSIKTDILWVKLVSSLIFIVRPVLYSIYVRKNYKISKPKSEYAKLEQKWSGIGQHLAYFLHSNTDVVLLTLFADVKLVAVYAVYSLVVSSIRAITEAFSGGMEAAFGALISKGEIDRLRKSYMKYKLLIVSATIVLFTCTSVLIVPFIKIYTKGITDANYIQPMFALMLSMAEATNCMVQPCAGMAVAANHLKKTRLGAYGEAIINIVVSCSLIFWNPLVGVAIGTLCATIFRGIYYMNYASNSYLDFSKKTVAVIFTLPGIILFTLSYVGQSLLLQVQINNYLQWFIYGAATFVIIGIPVALLYRFAISKLGAEFNNER